MRIQGLTANQRLVQLADGRLTIVTSEQAKQLQIQGAQTQTTPAANAIAAVKSGPTRVPEPGDNPAPTTTTVVQAKPQQQQQQGAVIAQLGGQPHLVVTSQPGSANPVLSAVNFGGLQQQQPQQQLRLQLGGAGEAQLF